MERSIRFLGLNLTKLSAEKKPDFSGNLEISPGIKIISIEKHKPELAKQEALKIDFEFSVDYKDLGKVELFGNLFLLLDPKTLKEVITQWKDKKLPAEINTVILNLILQRASLKALQLEEQLGLPLHFQMPSLKLQDKEQASEKPPEK